MQKAVIVCDLRGLVKWWILTQDLVLVDFRYHNDWLNRREDAEVTLDYCIREALQELKMSNNIECLDKLAERR